MSRPALLSLLVFVLIFGYSECSKSGTELSDGAKEIDEIYKQLHTGKSLLRRIISKEKTLEKKLSLINCPDCASEVHNIGGKLAPLFAKLVPNICDPEAIAASKEAMALVKKHVNEVKKPAYALLKILRDYQEQAWPPACDREIQELESTLADSPPSSTLDDKLELIKALAARSRSNGLAVALARLNPAKCNLAGIKAAQMASREVSEHLPPKEQHPLKKFFANYFWRMMEVCFKDAVEAWNSDRGSLRSTVTSDHQHDAINRITPDLRHHWCGSVRREACALYASHESHDRRVGQIYYNSRRDDYLNPLWKMSAISESCETLIKLEQSVGVLEPIFEATTGMKAVTIEKALGEWGSERSVLAVLASRWKACVWRANIDFHDFLMGLESRLNRGLVNFLIAS